MASKWTVYKFFLCTELLNIKKEPGVYAMYLDEDMYIGQSSNVNKRIANHKIHIGYGGSIMTPWGEFNKLIIKISYSIKYGDWAMRELRLIHKIKPTLNKAGYNG